MVKLMVQIPDAAAAVGAGVGVHAQDGEGHEEEEHQAHHRAQRVESVFNLVETLNLEPVEPKKLNLEPGSSIQNRWRRPWNGTSGPPPCTARRTRLRSDQQTHFIFDPGNSFTFTLETRVIFLGKLDLFLSTNYFRQETRFIFRQETQFIFVRKLKSIHFR